MAKIKRYFKSWTDAETAYTTESTANTHANRALKALVKGEVTWKRKGKVRMALVAPTAPDGGTLLVDHAIGVYALGLEAFVHAYQGARRPPLTTEYKEEQDLLALAEEMLIERNKIAGYGAEVSNG